MIRRLQTVLLGSQLRWWRKWIIDDAKGKRYQKEKEKEKGEQDDDWHHNFFLGK